MRLTRGRRRAPPAVRGAALVAALAAAAGGAAGEPAPPFRVGFSRAMFAEINEADARAAMTVWARTLGHERGLTVDPVVRFFNDAPAMADALRDETTDAVICTYVEFRDVDERVRTGPWFGLRVAGEVTQEYVLLVDAASSHAAVADLRGKAVSLHRSPLTCLARDWLDGLAIDGGVREGASGLFGPIREVPKVTAAVLPVFFGQAEAAVATASDFRTLAELNPQIGRRLRVIARSPRLVTEVLAFRASFRSPERERLLAELERLHSSPAGQQVLTVFRGESTVALDRSALRETESFLARARSRRVTAGGAGRTGRP